MWQNVNSKLRCRVYTMFTAQVLFQLFCKILKFSKQNRKLERPTLFERLYWGKVLWLNLFPRMSQKSLMSKITAWTNAPFFLFFFFESCKDVLSMTMLWCCLEFSLFCSVLTQSRGTLFATNCFLGMIHCCLAF